MDPATEILHASCVAFGRRGVLILGPSGAGKSSLALQLMAFGAELVADDRVALWRSGTALRAAAPPGLPALIEARGVGLLNARLLEWAEVVLAVELCREQAPRLPPRDHISLLQSPIEVVRAPLSGHLPSVIRQYLLAGRGE